MIGVRAARLPSAEQPGATLCLARSVSASLGRRAILHDIDIDLHAGELVAIAGPNGAGKSTLFAVLAGDVPASSGTVEVAGRPLRSWTPVELAQRRAVLPQHVSVSFPFRVREVVEMGRSPWVHTPRHEDDESAVYTAMVTADILDLAERPLTSLSGGERARVAFARTLAQGAQALLLDEPTAALDVRHQQLLLAAVRRRVQDGAGALVVMHDLPLAAAYADRIVLMRHGRVTATGTPAEVMRPELLTDVYEHEIDVITREETGEFLIAARRL